MEIIHSPNGTWGFRTIVGLDPATGKRKRVSRFGFPRRKDAEAALREIQESIKKQQYVPGSNVTFEDFAADWLKIYSQQVKISTVRIREHNIAWLNRYFAKIPLQRITKRDYQMFLLDLKDKLQPNTICGVHAAAKMIFKKAREFELIYNDPTEFASPPRPSRKIIDPEADVPQYLEKSDLQRFLDESRRHTQYGDYTVLFMLLAYTGLRIGEALALTWEDIDLDAATLKVTKTLYNPTSCYNAYQLLPPKTRTSARILSLPSQLVAELKKYRLEATARRFTFGELWHYPEGSRAGFVFTAPMHPGYPVTHRSVQHHIDHIQQALNPPLPCRVHPHIFRHTHASLLAEAGVDLVDIMDRLGHSDDTTTRKIYLHVTKRMKRRAAEKFAELMER